MRKKARLLLQGKGRKSLLYKGKILKNREATLYNMPPLEKRTSVNDLSFLQKTEDIERQAYEKGFASGEKTGIAAGEQKISLLIERLEKMIEELTVFKANLVKDLEPQVVNLAIAIARKIVIEELSIRPEIIVTIVKEALRKLQRTGDVTIKINPTIHDLFMRKKPELLEIHEEIILQADPNVPLTGPLVIGQTEEAVTDIDTLLADIMEGIREITQPQTNTELNRVSV